MQGESYNISEIIDKYLWDSFVTSQPSYTFLHSWAWGDFNAAMGDRIRRLGVYDNKTLIAVALAIKVHAKRGNFLFVPHGPVVESRKPAPIMKVLVEKMKEIAKQERVSFIRISPVFSDAIENKKLFSDLGFRPAPIHMHAETTRTLDLTPSEDDLLKKMRKTTRNLIRRAQKVGVEVHTGASEKDVEIFHALYQETVSKHHFTPFSLTYLTKEVIILSREFENQSTESSEKACDAQVFTAWRNNKPLASAIVVFYGNSAFYHHGASIQSKVPAAYLLQWEAIREAKRRGHTFYNFWGIVREEASAGHPWQGITLFKKGFSGFQTDYLHAQDLPLSWKYWPSWVIETLRKKRRNL